MELNREITSLIGLPLDKPGSAQELYNLLSQSTSNPDFRITIISAHCDALEIPPDFVDTMWNYSDKDNMPHKVSNLVKIIEPHTDLLFLAICNPGRKDINDSKCSVIYPHGNINALNDNVGSTVCLNLPNKIN